MARSLFPPEGGTSEDWPPDYMQPRATKAHRLTCHRCGSPDLILRETRHNHAEWDGGLYVADDGTIEASGEGIFSEGDIQSSLTEIECEGCDHIWRPRRRFTGARHD
jgi:hypothetical protein